MTTPTAKKSAAQTPKKFEEALARLEQIVQTLESGQVELEESLKLFEEGRKLSGECLSTLQDMERKVRKVLERPDGTVELKEFEPPASDRE